ncbi:MAG: phage holin family protein [Rhodoglobus sp.]|nr:phage holin family protein [Rhodoglobus sp.]
MSEYDGATRPSLLGLIRDVPGLVSRLFREELRAAKAEIAEKAKAAGVGIGVVAGGCILALLALGTLIASAVLGLAVAVPAWLAALIVALVLLVIAAVLVFLGVKRLQAGMPPAPTETVKSVREDVRVIKGSVS